MAYRSVSLLARCHPSDHKKMADLGHYLMTPISLGINELFNYKK